MLSFINLLEGAGDDQDDIDKLNNWAGKYK
jgi:hypothetical protein